MERDFTVSVADGARQDRHRILEAVRLDVLPEEVAGGWIGLESVDRATRPGGLRADQGVVPEVSANVDDRGTWLDHRAEEPRLERFFVVAVEDVTAKAVAHIDGHAEAVL